MEAEWDVFLFFLEECLRAPRTFEPLGFGTRALNVRVSTVSMAKRHWRRGFLEIFFII